MIEHPAAVIAVDRDNNSVWVNVHKPSQPCGACSEYLHSKQATCSIALFAKLSAKSDNTTLKITTPLPLQVGDRINLGIQETQLLRYSLLIYMTPLAGFILSALVAQMINNNNDWLMTLAGLSGLIAGFVAVKWFYRKKISFYPIISWTKRC